MKYAALKTYSDLELALMIKLDVFGTGQKRKDALGSRYAAAQKIVNQIGSMNMIPAGSGSAADPAKLQKAIDDAFADELRSLREEIVKKYDKI